MQATYILYLQSTGMSVRVNKHNVGGLVQVQKHYIGGAPYFLRREEVNVKQFPLAVHQRQERHRHVVVCVEVGARAAIVKAVILHGHQC